ncbi:M56 family metallopeptidase [Paludisphaera soli]|uniref:M56 family metallopeptidase n=1 Tax=Paludisphaera soli TaxID=2712865 RepID=UPI0013EAA551|nr:M56 family metallopeptidase [Paludisphaera soli]
MSDAFLGAALAAGGFGLTWLAQSSALLLLGLAAGRWAKARGPALQSIVYRTTLAAVLLGPVASAALAAMGFDGIAIRLPEFAPAEPPAATIAAIEPEPAPRTEPIAVRAAFDESPREPAPEPSWTPPAREAQAPIEAVAPTTPEPEPGRPETIARAAAAGVAAWAFGTLLLLARMLVQQIRMRGLRATAALVEPELQATCDEIAGRLGVAPPPVRRSPFLPSPCLDGLRRPMILLPEGADDPRDAFVHELAHLARRDAWWNLARRLAVAALWFQPLLWALSRRLESSAEEVCDDVVVAFGADRARYAELLVDLAGRALPPLGPGMVGMVSPRSLLARRVARILDASRPLMTRAGRRALLTVLAIGLASTAVAGLLRVGDRPAAEESAPIEDDQAPAPADPTFKTEPIRGRVVDQAGSPVAGAGVTAWSMREGRVGPGGVKLGSYEERRGTTDDEGRFELAGFDTPPADPKYPMRLVAVAKGHGPGTLGEDGTVRLGVPGPPIDGRVVDAQGGPVAGAKVRPQNVYFLPAGKQADPAEPWRIGDRTFLDDLPPSGSEVSTDAEGRFRIEGLGRDSVAILAISGPVAASRYALVLTRAMDRAELPNTHSFQDGRLGDRSFTEIHGAACTLVVESSRPIEGFVRDADDGSPIAGAFVTAKPVFNWPSPVDEASGCRTDAEGRYRLEGIPIAGDRARNLFVYPAVDRPYFAAERLALPPAPEAGPTTFDVKLKRGAWIEGRALDQADGKPVAARVDYVPMEDNPHAPDYLPAPPGAVFTSRLHGERFRTDAEGRFRVLGMPGRGVVLVKADDLGYRVRIGAEAIERLNDVDRLATYLRIAPGSFHAMKAVEVADAAPASVGDVRLVRGGSVLLRFVDEAGAPAPARLVSGRLPNSLDEEGFVLEQAEARILGLDPGEVRTVMLQNFDRNLGAILTVAEGDPERTVVVPPTVLVTGRMVHSDGRPAKGQVEVEALAPDRRPRPSMAISSSDIDAEGRFRCVAYRGAPIRVFAMNLVRENPNGGRSHSTKKVPGGFEGFDLVRDREVDAAGPIDLGTFDVDTGKPAEAVAGAEAPKPKPIRGRVLDADGRPVAGAAVVGWRYLPAKARAVELREDASTQSIEVHRATTDADGKYEIPGFAPIAEEGPRDPRQRDAQVSVLAAARGFGAALARDGEARLPGGDQPIDGRVVDPQGKPVEGARVRIASVEALAAGATADAVEPWKLTGRSQLPGEPLAAAIGAEGLTTDADGRFRVEGLGRDALAYVEVTRPDVATTTFLVLARAMEPRRPQEPRQVGGTRVVDRLSGRLIHGSTCTLTVEPGWIVEGVVREAGTREPIAGVVVGVESERSPQIPPRFSAATDEQGRYRIVGVPRVVGDGPRLSVHPRAEQPFFIRRGVETKPDVDGRATCDVELHRGVWITGQVIDKADGKAVAATVDYVPAISNPRAGDYLEPPSIGGHTEKTELHGKRFHTDASGAFRVLGIPGRGIVAARAEDESYRLGTGVEAVGKSRQGTTLPWDYFGMVRAFHGYQTVDVPEGATTFACEVSVERGRSVVLKFVDEAGAPVSARIVSGRQPERSGIPSRSPATDGVTEEAVEGLSPGEVRKIAIQSPDGQRGARLTIAADSPHRTVLVGRKVPITGRLVRAEGPPFQARILVSFSTNPNGFGELIEPMNPIDEQGRFRFLADVGGPYNVSVANAQEQGSGLRVARDRLTNGFQRFFLTRDLVIEPGKPIDFGTFDVDKGKPVLIDAGAGAVPITGRIVDRQGRPVAGAMATIEGIRAPKQGDLAAWLEEARAGEDGSIAGRLLAEAGEAKALLGRRFATDADGRFRIDGIPAERVVRLAIAGDAIAYAEIDVVTRPGPPTPAPGFSNPYGAEPIVVHGPDFTHTSAPSRPIEGIVTDAATGVPIPGAEVRSYRFAGSNFVAITSLRTTAGPNGRFRLVGMPSGEGNVILAMPATSIAPSSPTTSATPHMFREIPIPDAPGDGPIEVSAALHEGLWILGRLTDEETGEPIAGADVHYLPLRTNPFTRELPEFDESELGASRPEGRDFRELNRTRADGSFRIVGLPGPAVVGAVEPSPMRHMQGQGYDESTRKLAPGGRLDTYSNPNQPSSAWPTVMKPIDPPAGAKTVVVELAATRGASVRVRVVDDRGEPATGAEMYGRTRQGEPASETQEASEFEVLHLRPDETRSLSLRHEGKGLGAVVELRPGDDTKGPVEVKLVPLARIVGKVTDVDGSPASAAAVHAIVAAGVNFGFRSIASVADAEGRFAVAAPAGCKYVLIVSKGGLAAPFAGRKDALRTAQREVEVEPGRTADAGEIRLGR